MATTAKGTPYVESSDLVANYPAVSLALAEHIDDFGGKVLQVVRATDATFTTTTSTSFVDATGMTVTITPQRSTSAIIIIANFIFSRDGAADEALYAITDSSNNVISGAESDLIFHNSSTLLRMSTMTIAYATPATTSATTYKLRLKATAGVTVQVNNNRGKTGQMYAIEVSA